MNTTAITIRQKCKKVQQSLYRPGQGLGAPERRGSQNFYTIGTKGGRVVSPAHRSLYPPRGTLGTRFS